jgi:hypothetical protein
MIPDGLKFPVTHTRKLGSVIWSRERSYTGQEGSDHNSLRGKRVKSAI